MRTYMFCPWLNNKMSLDERYCISAPNEDLDKPTFRADYSIFPRGGWVLCGWTGNQCFSKWTRKPVMQVDLSLHSAHLYMYICPHYENTPIQIYRKFHLQKLKKNQIKPLIFFIFLLKT